MAGPFGVFTGGGRTSLDDHDDLVVAGGTVGDWFGALVGLDCAVRVGRPHA